jgi:hypothetical protein
VLLTVLLLVLFAGLLQLNAALGRIEVAGEPSTTAIGLFGLSPAKATESARTAWCVWHHYADTDPLAGTHACLDALRGDAPVGAAASDSDVASRLLLTFVIIGTIVEVGAGLAAAMVLRRLRPVLRDEPVDAALRVATQRRFLFPVVAVFTAFTVVANAAIGILADADASPQLINGWAPVIWVMTALAWATAGILLLLLAVLMIRWLRPHWPTVRLIVARLRLPIAVLLVYALILSGIGTDQVQDALLANAYRPLLLVFTVLAAVVLTLQVWRSPLRILSTAATTGDPVSPRLPLIFAVGAAVAGVWWRELWGLAAVALLVVVLSTLVSVFPWRAGEQTDAGTGNPDRLSREDYDRVMQAVHWLAALPLFLLGVFMVRSGTVTAVLEPNQGGVVALVATGVVVALVSPGVPMALRGLESFSWADASYDGRRHWLNLGVFAVNLAVAIAVYADPFGVPVVVGPIAMVLFFLGLVLAALSELQRWGQRRAPVAGLRLVGFRRTPVFALLTVWFIIGSIADTDGHDAARVLTVTNQSPPLTLGQQFDRWAAANCAAGGASSDTPVTMAFVAASGGGIRAAYWTAGALDRLFPADGTPCVDDRQSVFAVSGASGGSVGAMSWVVHQSSNSGWYKQAFGTDYLSSALSWLLYVDIPRSIIGFGGVDRAAVLEESMERSQPELNQPFLATYASGPGWVPLALLNGTSAETGCRALVAPVQLGGFDQSDNVESCRSDPGKGSSAGQTGAALIDLTNGYVCSGQDLRRSTAAVLSARFPYVTPSGSFVACDRTGRVSVVDGGYVDNTGSLSTVDLFTQVRPYIDCHNDLYFHTSPLPANCATLLAGAPAPTRPIRPVFIHIDNGYASVAQAPALSRPHELLLPPLGYLNAASTINASSLQRAFTTFGCSSYVRVANRPNPDIQAPLGWTMSPAAQDDLDGQLAQIQPLASLTASAAQQCGTDGATDAS